MKIFLENKDVDL